MKNLCLISTCATALHHALSVPKTLTRAAPLALVATPKLAVILGAAFVLIAPGAALAASCPGETPPATVPTVACGSDYFQTAPGTAFTFMGVSVPLTGVPFGPGSTDTIVQRLQDTVLNGAATNIQLTALQLKSTAPIPGIGTVFVSLDPAKLALDTGMITISGSPTGGTFASFFDVFFDICTQPGVLGVGCGAGVSIATGNGHLGPTPNQGWVSTPPPGAGLVPGTDDGGPSDQPADLHTGLDPNEVDFFPFDGYVFDSFGNPVIDPVTGRQALVPKQECDGGSCTNEDHFRVLARTVPEPGTLALLGVGLLGLVTIRRRLS